MNKETKGNHPTISEDNYVTKVQEMPNGELFVELPQKLIDQLGWEVGDEVEWEESQRSASSGVSTRDLP